MTDYVPFDKENFSLENADTEFLKAPEEEDHVFEKLKEITL